MKITIKKIERNRTKSGKEFLKVYDADDNKFYVWEEGRELIPLLKEGSEVDIAVRTSKDYVSIVEVNGKRIEKNFKRQSSEIEKAIERKEKSIKVAQENKEDSIKMAGAIRDATLFTINDGEYATMTDEQRKEKWLMWRKWLLERSFNDKLSDIIEPF